MMWTTVSDLREQLRRRWVRGDLLRELMDGETVFPLQLALKCPSSAELTTQFQAVRDWAAELVAVPQLRIGWRDVRHRVHGMQRLPYSAWVDTLDDALALIGKRSDAARFIELRDVARDRPPAATEWLARRPRRAVELAAQWPRLLAVVDWLVAHPRPGIYLRQVDIPGVDSKFIETHRSVLIEMLDLALPAEAIAADRSGVSRFAARYGFLDKPARIRFRVLDERITLLPGPKCPDVTLDSDSFARLDIPVQRVFVTENETNFLAFPPVADAIVVFGAGYGWDALAGAAWLKRCSIFYWGDIDTHGFAILDQLRSRFAHVVSLMMDRATLTAHEALWGEEGDQVHHDLFRLTADERALFNDLRDNRIQQNLRLEQERVAFPWVIDAIGKLGRESG